MPAAERFTLREQYEELELLYLGNRNSLRDLEARGKTPKDELDRRYTKLRRLRAARETIYLQARAEDVNTTPPQDFES